MSPVDHGTSGNRRAWWIAVVVGMVLLLVAGVGTWAVTRDDGHGNARLAHIRTELLAQAHPRSSCPNAPAPPPVAAAQTLISVVRVVDHCLAFGSEAVASIAVPARLAMLRADPGVVAADVPAKVMPTDVAADTRPGSAAAGAKPEEQWALEDLHADQVRKLWPAGADVRVAIIDTGIDDSNPDLAGQVVEKEPWAHIYRGEDDFHGTHVAGIVAAKDDGHGVLGLTPGAKLLDVQYWDERSRPDGEADEVGDKIRWAVDHGADVLNMSFGGKRDDTEEAALLYAEQAGVIAVAAAGNCGDPNPKFLELNHCNSQHQLQYPAGYEATVISVANYTEDHDRDGGSTATSSVDVAAPGAKILSTCLAGQYQCTNTPHCNQLLPPNKRHDCTEDDCRRGSKLTCKASGTSMATPFVSATAALLRARHPDASPAAIREAILRSTRPAPGHPAGMHSDQFGTGLLDPLGAAAYLDQHPAGTMPRPSGSSGTVGPDTIVAGYVGADHKVALTTASGGKIPVAGVQVGPPAPRIAFSRDGAWFAAADGKHLAIVNVQSRRQETVECACTGVAFNAKGQLLTADGNILATYEPATATRLHGVRVHNTSGTGLPTFMSMTPEGTSGDVTVVNGRFASAGYGVFGIRPNGTTFLIGRGPDDPGVTKVVVSDDGRWVAWTTYGVCNQQSQLGVADLSHPGASANVTGATAQGEALQIQFADDTILAAWAPMQHGPYGCTDPAWPPTQWQIARPAMDTGTDDKPAPATWSRAGDARTVLHRWPSGPALYLQPTTTVRNYQLTFGPAPGGAGPLDLAQVTDAIARPDGSTPTPTQLPSPPATTPSTPTPPAESPATLDAAIARYEKFLHALGNSDAATICEIAGPGMNKAQAQGIGPCPNAWRVVFGWISSAQRAALKTATVDRARILTRTRTKIDIPAAAIKTSVTFTSDDIGDRTLEYLHSQWYITD